MIGPSLVLGLILGAAEPGANPTAGPLSGEEYGFCHDPKYPLTAREHAFCPLIGAQSEACPALPAACKAEAKGTGTEAAKPNDVKILPVASASAMPSAEPPDRGDKGSKADEDHAREDRPEPDASLAPPPSGAARVVFFVLIGALFLALAWPLLRNFRKGGEEDEERAGDEPEAEAAPKARARPAEPALTDVERLLQRAQAAAGRGDYARAIDDAYAALLRRLDGAGLIDLHPSRTNGDYLRKLRDRPDVAPAVREAFRAVERVQFGTAEPSASSFQAVMARVLPLCGKALAVALLFLGAASVSSCTPVVAAHDRGRHGDASPLGSKAVVALLRAASIDTSLRSDKLADVEGELTLVLLPGASIAEGDAKHLMRWVEEKGGRLVVAGEPPRSLGLGLVVSAGDLEVPPTLFAAAHRSSDAVYLGSYHGVAPVGPWLDVASSATAEMPPLLERMNGEPYARSAERGKGRVVVLADESLFTNVAMAIPENRELVVALLRSLGPGRQVELVDHWTGQGAESAVESLRRAALTPVAIQLLVLLAVFLAWKGARFARPRDPVTHHRRAFADHARALGLGYERAGATRHVFGLYARWALDRLRERVQRRGGRGLSPLAEAIARRTGRAEGEVMRVLVEALSARDETSATHDEGAPAEKPEAGARPVNLVLMRELEGFLDAATARHENR